MDNQVAPASMIRRIAILVLEWQQAECGWPLSGISQDRDRVVGIGDVSYQLPLFVNLRFFLEEGPHHGKIMAFNVAEEPVHIFFSVRSPLLVLGIPDLPHPVAAKKSDPDCMHQDSSGLHAGGTSQGHAPHITVNLHDFLTFDELPRPLHIRHQDLICVAV